MVQCHPYFYHFYLFCSTQYTSQFSPKLPCHRSLHHDHHCSHYIPDYSIVHDSSCTCCLGNNLFEVKSIHKQILLVMKGNFLTCSCSLFHFSILSDSKVCLCFLGHISESITKRKVMRQFTQYITTISGRE